MFRQSAERAIHRKRPTSVKGNVDRADTTLWTLYRDGHVAEAVQRVVEGFGVELRFLWDGEP